MIAAKVVTAIASLFTVVTFVGIIRGFRSNRKKDESRSASKAFELSNIEVEKVRQKDEYGMFRRLLKSKFQNLVDRHSILHTTTVELARVLRLQDCVIWMPRDNQHLLRFAHSLEPGKSDYNTVQPVISLANKTVEMVLKESGAIRIPVESKLARYSGARTSTNVVELDYVLAMRLPVLTTCSELIRHKASTVFAIIVLIVSKKEQNKWGKREIDIVKAAVDQVIIALSDATIMEESPKARGDLKQKSIAIQFAKDQSKPTTNTQKNLINKTKTPLKGIGVISSLLVESNLNEVHKYTVGIMQRSNKVISKLMDEILDFSKPEFDSLRLNSVKFLLPRLIHVAEILLEPVATSKGLQLTFMANQSLPRTVVGDEIRILYVLLNIVGNAIKFTEKGNVRVDISSKLIDGKDHTEPRMCKLTSCANIHFVVKGMGGGISSTIIPQLFNKSDEVHNGIAGSGLSWPISMEFTQLMKGKIWIENEAAEHGTTCHFIFPVEIVHNYAHEPSLWGIDYELFTFEDAYTISDIEGAVLQSGRPPSSVPSYHRPPNLRPSNCQIPASTMTPESISKTPSERPSFHSPPSLRPKSHQNPTSITTPESIIDTGHHSLSISASSAVDTQLQNLSTSPKKLRSRTSCQRSLF